MNFLAHTVVSDRLAEPSPARSLGAALPDLVPMARLRFERAHLPATMAEGVDCHVLTDRSFHVNAVFLRGVEGIRDGLADRGIGRGPSRAIGHAGWELLLDGCLVRRPGVRAGFLAALGQAAGAGSAFAVGDRDRWSRFATMLSTDHWWSGYDDPLFVAQRLHDRLRHSARLAFDRRDVDVVAAVLDEARAAIELEADSVIESVVAQVGEGRK